MTTVSFTKKNQNLRTSKQYKNKIPLSYYLCVTCKNPIILSKFDEKKKKDGNNNNKLRMKHTTFSSLRMLRFRRQQTHPQGEVRKQ